MAPVELEYSLNGESKEKIAAEDGVTARIDTPAGPVFAKVKRQGKNWLTRCPLVDRIGAKFPSDPEHIPYSTRTDGLHYHVNSIFDPLIPSRRKMREAKKLTKTKKYSTSQGEVVIKVTGLDQE